MKNQRNNAMMPYGMGGFLNNPMMFPNFMNDNYQNVDVRLSALENKVKTLETRISRLENPYQTNQGYQNPNQNYTSPYQTTQNSDNYNGEMYMM